MAVHVKKLGILEGGAVQLHGNMYFVSHPNERPLGWTSNGWGGEADYPSKKDMFDAALALKMIMWYRERSPELAYELIEVPLER